MTVISGKIGIWAHHLNNLRVYVICDDTTLGGDIFQHFV